MSLRDLQRQAKGGIEVKGDFAIQNGLAGGFQIRQQFIQVFQPSPDGLLELFFLTGEVVQDCGGVALQFGIEITVFINHHLSNLRHEGFIEV